MLSKLSYLLNNVNAVGSNISCTLLQYSFFEFQGRPCQNARLLRLIFTFIFFHSAKEDLLCLVSVALRRIVTF